MLKRFSLPIIASLLMTTTPLTAQEATPETAPETQHTTEKQIFSAKSKPTHIALFKNGYGVVVSKANLDTASTFTVEEREQPHTFQIDLFPNASQGTFWMNWSNWANLTNIKSTYAKATEKAVASNIQEVIRANIGNNINLKIDKNWIRATILDVPEIKQQNPGEPRPLIFPPPRFSDIVYLKTGDAILVKRMHQIQDVQLPAGSNIPQVDHTSHKPVLQFDANLNPIVRGVTLPTIVKTSYLAKGIAWAPSYIVNIDKLTDDNLTADLSAKAVLINDLIDLDNVSAELIAGFPHMQFQTASSGMTLQPLDQFINNLMQKQARYAGRGNGMSNVMSQRMDMVQEMSMAAPSMPQQAVKGETTEDLYFYQLENVSLKKGERGYFPLFASEIGAKSIYTWDIPDFVDQYDNYMNPQQQKQLVQPVWHSLELTNNTDRPWTTAPAVTMKDGRILGQDTITYTAPKATSRLKITQALAIKAKQQEEELSRQQANSKQIAIFAGNSRNYAIITARGSLELTNYKSKPVEIEVSKTLSGQVLKSSNDPEIIKLAKDLDRLNPTSKLTWKITLKPGLENKVKLTYEYKVISRR
ncbi:hypothetical protein [Poriferisphaera sp. WC338]|uniref:hypothetical protein n=1 Tax=Poriferisphaera sp. WC338 TaxID=3425129 RepID=UPI003D81AD7E